LLPKTFALTSPTLYKNPTSDWLVFKRPAVAGFEAPGDTKGPNKAQVQEHPREQRRGELHQLSQSLEQRHRPPKMLS
jgi:hypothetical protein